MSKGFFISSKLYNFLVAIKILQVQKYEHQLYGTFTKSRYNPYNPITYLWILITIIICILKCLIIELKELNFKSTFKYQ